MIDFNNATITCDLCGRTERIKQTDKSNCKGKFLFVEGENGTRYETVNREDICQRCLELDKDKG